VNNKLLRGIIPAIVTPFNDKGGLALESVAKLIENFIDYGCEALYVCGVTGECLSLSVTERKEMAKEVMKVMKDRLPIVIHVGGTKTTNGAVELAKHAEIIGATAVSSMAPVNSPRDLNAAVEHYRKIGEAVSIPFYVYWIAKTAQPVTAKIFLEKMEKIPNFSGIKFSDNNLYLFERIKEYSGGKLNLLTGVDEMNLSGMVMKSDGAIGSTYNVMPKLFVNMRRDFENGNIKGAMEAQRRANYLIEAMLETEVGIVPGIKAILNYRGFNVGSSRKPHKDISRKQLEVLLGIVNKYKLE